MSVQENYNISNKIEKILQEKYKFIINVVNKTDNLLQIRIYIKNGIECEFLVMYFEYLSLEENIKDLIKRIDKRIPELFYK